jgi:ABC-type protease/lipase transport system fused ATPase/permease subunit
VFGFFVNLLAFTSPLYMQQICDRVIGSRNETCSVQNLKCTANFAAFRRRADCEGIIVMPK